MNQTINTAFAEEIMEEYPYLYFIAFDECNVLAVSKKTGKAHFFYEINEDMSFHFNLLSEVTYIRQTWFEDIIRDLHYTLETKETETDYFNTLVKQ